MHVLLILKFYRKYKETLIHVLHMKVSFIVKYHLSISRPLFSVSPSHPPFFLSLFLPSSLLSPLSLSQAWLCQCIRCD